VANLPTLSKDPEVTPPIYIDPSLSLIFDSGYESRRSRYNNPKRKITLLYHGLTKNDVVLLVNFIRDTLRGTVGTFSYNYPLKETITGVSSGTVTTNSNHGFRNGDTVVIASTGAPDGTHTISGTTATTFVSSGGGTGSAGTAQLRYLKMRLDLSDGEFNNIEKLIGPWQDNKGGWNVELPLLEVF
jgi:hypothetical protein